MFVQLENPRLKLEYIKLGTKPDILVFLHGGGTDGHYAEPFLDTLKDQYTIYSFSYPGFGLSQNTYPYSLKNFFKIISAFLKIHNIQKFTLMGYSFGGGLATYFASHNIEFKIKELILISPATYRFYKTPWYLQKCFEEQRKIQLEIDKNYYKLIDDYANYNPEYTIKKESFINKLRLYFTLRFSDFRKNSENIDIPIKIFLGDKDIILDSNIARSFWNSLNKDNIEIYDYPEDGHGLLFRQYKSIKKKILND